MRLGEIALLGSVQHRQRPRYFSEQFSLVPEFALAWLGFVVKTKNTLKRGQNPGNHAPLAESPYW